MKLENLATVALTQPEKNLLATLESKFGLTVKGCPGYTPTGNGRANPYSGAHVDLTALEAILYDFLHIAYSNYERTHQMSYCGVKMPIQTYDRTKYLFMKLNNDAYMTLLD